MLHISPRVEVKDIILSQHQTNMLWVTSLKNKQTNKQKTGQGSNSKWSWTSVVQLNRSSKNFRKDGLNIYPLQVRESQENAGEALALCSPRVTMNHVGLLRTGEPASPNGQLSDCQTDAPFGRLSMKKNVKYLMNTFSTNYLWKQ